VEIPPKGLRWEEKGPLAARLRPRISRLYFCVFGAVWNLALGPGHARLHSVPVPPAWTMSMFDWVGLLAGVFFLLLAVRELGLVTHVVFDASNLVISAPLAPWGRFESPLIDIQSFEVIENRDATYRVVMRTQAGVDRKLPLNFEAVALRGSWSRKRLFASPVTFASFVAKRLTEMLDTARRSGHNAYRL
jgi:hypothetical protein